MTRPTIALLATLAVFAVATGHASAQSFDFDRYGVLDGRVVASDEAYAREEAGTPGWDRAARFAVSARSELFNYIGASIGDPSIDAETLQALLQMRATLAIDATRLLASLQDCAAAREWFERAFEVQHPSVAPALASAQEAADACVEPPPATPEPDPAAQTTPPPAQPGGPPTDPEPRGGVRIGRVVAGVGLIAVGGGMAGGAVAASGGGEEDRAVMDLYNCTQRSCTTTEANEFLAAKNNEDARVARMWTFAGIGAAAGISGTVLLATAKRRNENRNDVTIGATWTGRTAALRVVW